MAYTNARGVAEAAIREQGFGLGNGKMFDLYSVYECIDSPTHGPDDVYWMLFFGNNSFDDMEHNPFVYEYIKVYARYKKTEYVIGDLVHALTVRAHAYGVMYVKFQHVLVDQYIEEFEEQDGIFGWSDQFYNPATGQLRRSELLGDLAIFSQELEEQSETGSADTTSDSYVPTRRAFDAVTHPQSSHIGEEGDDNDGI